MFLNLFKSEAIRGFTRRVHTQVCLVSLFEQRQKVENQWRKEQANQMEWNDDEDEQRRVFHEEEGKKIVPNNNNKKEQLKCEITGKLKQESQCECKGMCLAKKSETYLIHYEGGVGFIQ